MAGEAALDRAPCMHATVVEAPRRHSGRIALVIVVAVLVLEILLSIMWPTKVPRLASPEAG